MTRDAYGDAYKKGFRQTVRFLVSRGVPAEGATEAAQAGWVSGWEQRSQLRNEAFLGTWINTIALNFHRRALRRQARLCPLTARYEPSRCQSVAALDLDRILTVCAAPDRELLKAWLEVESVSEVADALGISGNAARIRFLRARRAARTRAESRRNTVAGVIHHGLP